MNTDRRGGLANIVVEGGRQEGKVIDETEKVLGGVCVCVYDCKSDQQNINRRPTELCFLLKEHTTSTHTHTHSLS